MNKERNNSLTFLDGLRGIAALYVMIGHARWFLWEGGSAFAAHSGNYSLPEKAQVYFFGLFKYGHQMVLFFFVLSGFVIHLKQAKSIQRSGTINLDGYLWKRFKRIFPPLIVALIITFVCDSLVKNMGASIFTHTTPDETVNRGFTFDHSIRTLLGNLGFLQTTYVPVFGSNGPLWSLKYEWWFYMLYPLFVLANKRSALWTALLVAALSLVTILGWSWGILLVDDILAYFFCWWLGCIAADIYAGRLKVPTWVFFIAMAGLLSIPLQAKLPAASSVVYDTIVAVGFFGLLSILLKIHSSGKQFRFLNWLKPLGDCSYTLYVIHGPILILANGVLLNYTGNVLPQSFVYVWLSIVCIPVLAYLLHFISEKPFLTKPVAKRPEVKVQDSVI